MIQALRIAATGMQAQQTNVDVLSNNLANINTAGFKRQNVAFEDLIYQNKIGVGSITSSTGTVAPTGAQQGLGVRVGAIYRINTQGPVNETGNTFDIALQGEGFFRVTDPQGETLYTRDGSFQLNQNGDLVSKEGFTVDPSINIPVDALGVTISSDGVVSAEIGGTVSQLGQITISMFANVGGLQSEGGNFFTETEASGTATDSNPGEDGSGELLQGFLESSNVDPIDSITDLITAQRAFELNSRIISTADEMLSAITQIT